MLWLLSAFAAPVQVALTFDDLPAQTLAPGRPSVERPADQLRITDALLAALAKHHAPATVFVNCGLLADDVLPTRWRDAGMELANHTHTHARASKVGLDAWKDEVRQCHERLASIGPEPPKHFRYPYLRRGEPELRDAGAAYLTDLGEVVAPVTIPTAEWRLAQLYDEAKTDARRAELRAGLVEHVLAGLAEAQRQVRERHGLEVPHVLLLHVNPLEADALDGLLTALEGAGARFVPLSEALADPYYARPDVVTVDASLPHQLRIEPAWQPGEPNWFHDAEAAIDTRYAPAE